MILHLLCLQAQTDALARQPQTIDVVSYQKVQHAMPDGSPDPAAPDNFYVRIKSHYVLITDSDGHPPDETGTRTVRVPERVYFDYQSFEETGKSTPSLRQAFREVMPPSEKSQWRRHEAGKASFGSVEQRVSSCYRYFVFHRRTEIEEVETHSEGKRRLTRIARRENWGSHTTVLAKGAIFDPSKERVYWCESKPEVRIDPPVYGYIPE